MGSTISIPSATAGRSVVLSESPSVSRIGLPINHMKRLPGTSKTRSRDCAFMGTKQGYTENMNTLTNTTVLLVDDSLDSCDLLRFAFEESGASVVTAQTVKAAIEEFRRAPAHAVIADIRIGTSDGYELLKAIRETN